MANEKTPNLSDPKQQASHCEADLRLRHQIGETGVSHDYINFFGFVPQMIEGHEKTGKDWLGKLQEEPVPTYTDYANQPQYPGLMEATERFGGMKCVVVLDKLAKYINKTVDQATNGKLSKEEAKNKIVFACSLMDCVLRLPGHLKKIDQTQAVNTLREAGLSEKDFEFLDFGN